MPVGFQSINEAGVYQIDDTYRNLQLKTKATVTAMTQVNTGTVYDGQKTYWYVDIVVTNGITPVVAINGNPTQYAVVGYMNVSGSTFTFRVFSDVDADFTYYVFDVYQGTPPTNGVGLEVYNAAGELQYTSDRYPFKPVQTILTTSLTEVTTTLASGPTYAVCTMDPGVFATLMSNVGDPKIPTPSECSQSMYVGGFKVDGNVIKTSQGFMLWFYQYRNDDYSCGVFGENAPQRVLVIDVTNA